MATPILKQSYGLSIRHMQMFMEGKHPTDDSKLSEKRLNDAIKNVLVYAKERFCNIATDIIHKNTISLYECQKYFHEIGGPIPCKSNKNVFMKPDGGIFFAIIDGKEIPILVAEDKVQGTNDRRFADGKTKQGTGNAIERGAKNIRGAEMLFANLGIFPYILFASGCDFHKSETIAKRLEMANMGFPNHYFDITPNTTEEDKENTLVNILKNININQKCNKNIASIFVKAHKWDEMKNGSSVWTTKEYFVICCKVIDLVAEYFESKINDMVF